MSSVTTRVGFALEPAKPLCQAVEDALTPHAARFSLIAAIQPHTPTPSTPDLCWDDTPALSTLSTPEDESYSDAEGSLENSPSLRRKNRSRLRTVTGLDTTPSKELRSIRIFDDKTSSTTPFIFSTETSIEIEQTRTVPLQSGQNENIPNDGREEAPAKEESNRPQVLDPSSPEVDSTHQQPEIKLEEEDHVSPSEVSDDLKEPLSPEYNCNDAVASPFPQLDRKISCQIDSTRIDELSQLTTNGGSLACDAEAPTPSKAIESHVRLTLTWKPSAKLCQVLPTKFIDLLRDNPVYCIATTLKKKRCRNTNWGKLTVAKIDTLLKGLVGPSSLVDTSTTISLVEDLAIQATCKRFHQKLVKSELTVLKEYSESESAKTNLTATQEPEDAAKLSNLSAIHLWLQDLLQPRLAVQSQSEIEIKVDTKVFEVPLNHEAKINHVELNTEVSTTSATGQAKIAVNTVAEMPAAVAQPKTEEEVDVTADLLATPAKAHVKIEMELSTEIPAKSPQPKVKVEGDQLGIETDLVAAMPTTPTQIRLGGDVTQDSESNSIHIMIKRDWALNDDTPTKRLRQRGFKQKKVYQLQNDYEVTKFAAEINIDWSKRKLSNEPTLPWSPISASHSTHLRYKFEPFMLPEARQTMSIASLIRYELERPLTLKDSAEEGYIYAYWHPGNFGYLKIGRTEDSDISKRLKEWQSQCKLEVKQITDPNEPIQAPVRHPVRIEQLIHAELQKYRLREPECIGCSRGHIEWFNAKPELALRVIKKWSQVSLYENGLLSKKITEDKIQELCKVTTLEELVNPLSKSSRRIVAKASVKAYPLTNPFSIDGDGTKESPAWLKPLAT